MYMYKGKDVREKSAVKTWQVFNDIVPGISLLSYSFTYSAADRYVRKIVADFFSV